MLLKEKQRMIERLRKKIAKRFEPSLTFTILFRRKQLGLFGGKFRELKRGQLQRAIHRSFKKLSEERGW